jgi:hypothetical protein
MNEHLVAISVAREKQTVCDSIPTIERVYDRTANGAFICVWPKCSFSRRDAAKLWRHGHRARQEDAAAAMRIE